MKFFSRENSNKKIDQTKTMKFKLLKTKLFLFFIIPIYIHSYAYADLTYGQKFIGTTLSGCAVGGAGAYIVAQNGGYDSQPRQILTFMGATTGCITGALFSYFFYHDNSETLQTKISAQQKTIQDLSLQMAQMQGEKQNGIYSGPSLPQGMKNPFDNLEMKEGQVKSKFDLSSLPQGLHLKSCQRLWEFSLVKDGNEIENSRSAPPQIIAVSKNFALVGFAFFYSPNDCFTPSSEEGRYAENYFPGMTDFLKRRVINYNLGHK